MAVLYTPHFMQFFDNNGDPLAAGLLYTYEAGTTTPKDTYTTAAGTISNPNPIVLDSSGRATIFIDGSYKFRLETSLGVLVRETDNISSFDTANASSGVINWATADTLASASTVNIGAATSNYVIITGTTTINAFDTIAQGAERLLRFNGSLTLTHNATSMILPGGVNIVTRAGDTARFISEGSGNWRLTSYSSCTEGQIAPLVYGCKLYQTTGTSVTIGTWTTLLFDTESWDDDGWHSTSVNTGRITFNFTGRVFIIGCYAPNTLNNTNMGTRILKNGTVIARNFGRTSDPASENLQETITCEIDVVPNDYIELQGFNSNGTVTSATGISGTTFSARRIK